MRSKHYKASQRMRDIQSPIIPIITNLIAETPGTISLGQGVVYFAPPQTVLERVSQLAPSKDYHLYSAVEGTPELRDSISNKLRNENNINLSGQQKVVVTAGANMAFMNAMMAHQILAMKLFYCAPIISIMKWQ